MIPNITNYNYKIPISVKQWVGYCSWRIDLQASSNFPGMFWPSQLLGEPNNLTALKRIGSRRQIPNSIDLIPQSTTDCMVNERGGFSWYSRSNSWVLNIRRGHHPASDSSPASDNGQLPT